MKSSLASLHPEPNSLTDLEALGSTRFVVTVDTEEEFDWSAPFSRDQHDTRHISAIPRFQSLCDDFGVQPCYLVDYPITQDAKAVELLSGYNADNRAEIGVQLHPWVNPPFQEPLSVKNSFACNLSSDLEHDKLTTLHNTIVANMGVRPDAYRAGRYGAGPNTPAILAELGIAIDSSVRTRFDYSAQGGPDYSQHPINPYWLLENRVMELPVTTIFAGTLRKVGSFTFGRLFGSHSMRSALARTAMLERIALTPEGIPLTKAILAIDLALEEGVRILNFSFHSPSLAVGNTPYVRSAEQLETFYIWWEAIFLHLASRGIRPTTMAEIKSATRFRQEL